MPPARSPRPTRAAGVMRKEVAEADGAGQRVCASGEDGDEEERDVRVRRMSTSVHSQINGCWICGV